jgi:hypothetical protein
LPLQRLERSDQRQTTTSRLRLVLRQQLIERRLETTGLGERLNFALIAERGLAAAQDLADRVSRYVELAQDLLDRLPAKHQLEAFRGGIQGDMPSELYRRLT